MGEYKVGSGHGGVESCGRRSCDDDVRIITLGSGRMDSVHAVNLKLRISGKVPGKG